MPGSEFHVSKWWCEQKNRYNPELKFCAKCIEPALWSRDRCVLCGDKLHQMTEEDGKLLAEKRSRAEEEQVAVTVLAVVAQLTKEYA